MGHPMLGADFAHSTSPDNRVRLPTIDDEAELQEQYNIDYHTLQSSLDPDELSRLEIEPVAIIFKRPRSEHSSRG
jgi:hypothetical protein